MSPELPTAPAEEFPPKGPVEVVLCYSHKDEPFCTNVQRLLTPLRKQGLITSWYDGMIGPGEEWQREIAAHLNSASIILLLLSRDFLASDYCYEVEMRHALERHEQGTARVIPIVVRPVDLTGNPLKRLKMLPEDERPVSKWGNRDDAYKNISEGIRAAVEALDARPESTPMRVSAARSTIPALTPQNSELEELIRQLAAAAAAAVPLSTFVSQDDDASRPRGDASAGADLAKPFIGAEEIRNAAAYLAARMVVTAKPPGGHGAAGRENQ
jgi:hypothetical protein